MEALRRNEIVVTSNLADDYPQAGVKDASSLLGREVPFGVRMLPTIIVSVQSVRLYAGLISIRQSNMEVRMWLLI